MMELHVWGTPDKVAIVDADCLATLWYMALKVPKDQFKVITSSNTDVSKSGKLPSLRINSKEQYDGIMDIIRYLGDQDYELDSFLNKEQKALNHGTLLYIHDKFQIVTDYVLFLNKENYEKYSRSVYKDYLPFPMQYNTPLHYRSLAKTNCARIGLTVEDKTQVEQEMLQNVPTVSKVQQLKHESMIEDRLVIKNSVSNMKCLTNFQSLIETIIKLQKELGTSKQKNLFGDAISSSDLLLLAHLYIQTHSNLPDQFITNFVLKMFPGFLETKTSNLIEIEKHLTDVILEAPTFGDSPNLFNFIRYAIF